MVLSAIPSSSSSFEELADVHVVLDHAVGVLVLAGDAAQLRLDVGAEMHAGTAPPDKPGLAGGLLLLDELDSAVGGFVIDRLHALFGQRTRILDPLRAIRLAQEWMTPRGRTARGRSCRPSASCRRDSPRSPALPRHSGDTGCRKTRRSHGWSADARRGRRDGSCRTDRSHSPAPSAAGDGRILFTHTELCSRQADLGQAGAKHALAHDER